MKLLLQALIDIFNFFHRLFSSLSNEFGLGMNDKALHFYVIGVIFFILYLIINPIYKKLSQYSIKLLSFIYVFTLALVVSVAIEIAQYQSRSGQMDLMDVIWSLFGFLVIFLGFKLFMAIIKFIIKQVKKAIAQSKQAPRTWGACVF